MKKIIICVFDALNAYHESNTKMIEKIRDEATQKALILEAYSLKRCMELLLKEEPDELFILDSVGISGAILLLKQINPRYDLPSKKQIKTAWFNCRPGWLCSFYFMHNGRNKFGC